VTSSLAVFEAKIRVKSALMLQSRLKTREKENVEIKKYFYMKLQLKDCFGMEFTIKAN